MNRHYSILQVSKPVRPVKLLDQRHSKFSWVSCLDIVPFLFAFVFLSTWLRRRGVCLANFHFLTRFFVWRRRWWNPWSQWKRRRSTVSTGHPSHKNWRRQAATDQTIKLRVNCWTAFLHCGDSARIWWSCAFPRQSERLACACISLRKSSYILMSLNCRTKTSRNHLDRWQPYIFREKLGCKGLVSEIPGEQHEHVSKCNTISQILQNKVGTSTTWTARDFAARLAALGWASRTTAGQTGRNGVGLREQRVGTENICIQFVSNVVWYIRIDVYIIHIVLYIT